TRNTEQGRNRGCRAATELLSFFFSSRRRHTRSDRDWSSDVCSSDLSPPVYGRIKVALAKRSGALIPQAVVISLRVLLSKVIKDRSEERRVGKECRSWWSP